MAVHYTKEFLYLRNNAYDTVVSVNEDEIRYITENEEFPHKDEEIENFLSGIEDDSSWETGLSLEEILKENEILARRGLSTTTT